MVPGLYNIALGAWDAFGEVQTFPVSELQFRGTDELLEAICCAILPSCGYNSNRQRRCHRHLLWAKC